MYKYKIREHPQGVYTVERKGWIFWRKCGTWVDAITVQYFVPYGTDVLDEARAYIKKRKLEDRRDAVNRIVY